MESKNSTVEFSSAVTVHSLTISDGSELRIALPLELEIYRHDIRRFLDAMVFKLRKNAHKGRWAGAKMRDYLEKLKHEVTELEDAINEGNFVEIILEGADVANFAMIVSNMAVENGE